MAIDTEMFHAMQSAASTGETWLMYLGLAALALIAVVALAPLLFRACAKVWFRASRLARAVFCVSAVGLTLYGGSKRGSISYPYTDVSQHYLYDNGSYVTNDAIYVSFTRMIAPASAPMLIDRRDVSSTNDTDWVRFLTTTFADFDNPQTIAFPAATNYNWIVYTTWTPGPTVVTNGVWHAYWGRDQKTGAYMIPVRTCVREGATVIATPKSVWDATNAVNTTTTGQKINSMTIKDMEAFK